MEVGRPEVLITEQQRVSQSPTHPKGPLLRENGPVRWLLKPQAYQLTKPSTGLSVFCLLLV